MADQFLSQQIQQRASNAGRLQDLISSNKNRFESDWKEEANKQFNEGLSKYSAKLQTAVAKDIASESEGNALLGATPAFYSIGKGTYKNMLSKGGKEFFDNRAQKIIDGSKSSREFVGEALGEAKQELKEAGQKISQKANQLLGTTGEKIKSWVDVGDNQLLQRQQDVAREMQLGDPEDIGLTDPRELGLQEQGTGEITSLPTSTSNSATRAAAEAGESTLTENVSADAAGATAGTTAGATGVEDAVTTGTTTAGVTGAEDAAGAIAATAAETGPGAILLGGLAAAIGAGVGLYDLFSHHSHKPKQFSAPSFTSSPAIQSRYDISKTILPSSTQTLGTGRTMQF